MKCKFKLFLIVWLAIAPLVHGDPGESNKVVSKVKAENTYPDEKPREEAWFRDYVSDEKFHELNQVVNDGLLKSLRPADDRPRIETKVSETVALRGTVVTPDTVIEDGIIVVEYSSEKYASSYPDRVFGTIKSVGPFNPKAVKCKIIDLTGNCIYPGFIDLHNHVAYNVFDLWTPTYDIYPNRNIWPQDPRYRDWKKLNYYFAKHIGVKSEMQKYAEIKALMGGETMMQGYSWNLKGNYGLVRSVENKQNILGFDFVGQNTMPVSKWWEFGAAMGQQAVNKIIQSFDSGKLRKYFIHLCEGVDDSIHDEFVKLDKFGLITKGLIAIHCTGLFGQDWDVASMGDMKLIWSPLSNLIMYNRTIDLLDAVKRGFPLENIALGPDWSPSGSPNQLFEAKIANEYSIRRLNGLITPKNILFMMTRHPAEIAGYQDYVGAIREGLLADFAVIKKKDPDPYASLLLANMEDVNLVMIDGQPLYGSLTYYKQFDKKNDYEIFEVGGVEKAIDITEAEVENGYQTMRVLLELFTQEFAALKKIIPFTFPDDVAKYCNLAPLFWPRPTSYDNLIFSSMMGKGSVFRSLDFTDIKSKSWYKKAKFSSYDQYKALKNKDRQEKEDSDDDPF